MTIRTSKWIKEHEYLYRLTNLDDYKGLQRIKVHDPKYLFTDQFGRFEVRYITEEEYKKRLG